MSDPVDLSKFYRKLEERRSKKAAELAELTSFADAVPEVEPPTFGNRSGLLERIDAMRHDPIVEVYDRLVAGQRDDGPMGQLRMQCPMPDHVDVHPSASMSTAKNVWFCHGVCEVGGGVFDMAGAAWGYAVPLRRSDVWEVKKRYAKEVHGLDYDEETEQLGRKEQSPRELPYVATETQAPNRPGSHPFEDDVAKDLYRLRVREAARARFRVEESRGTHTAIDLSYTFDDLLNEPDEKAVYTVDRLALFGTNTLLLGDSKTGKTAAVMSLVRSLVDGVPFYGQFSSRLVEGNVAYLNFEVDRGSSKRRFKELGLVNCRKFRPLSCRGLRFDLANPTTFAEMTEQLKRNEIEVLILDPWRRVFGGEDENSATQVDRYTQLIDELKESSGSVTDVFMPCHTSKRPERFQESARGSSGIENWYDNLWVFRKDQQSDGTYVRSFRLGVGRDSDQEDLMAYQRVIKDGFGSLHLESPGSRVLGGDDQKIVDFVGSHPGCSKADVERGCGIEHKRCVTLIDQLIGSGHLTRVPAPKRGLKDQLYAA